MRVLSIARPMAVGAGLLALCAAALAGEHGEKAFTCTNPASGANWQVKIDYDHGTVDAHPASISDVEISWHTTDGENYKLDPKSGNLTVIVASSTGGYFIHDHCNLGN